MLVTAVNKQLSGFALDYHREQLRFYANEVLVSYVILIFAPWRSCFYWIKDIPSNLDVLIIELRPFE